MARAMLHRLKRHPFAVRAFFRHALVQAYAFPREVLTPLLAPGLELDGLNGTGFLAIALVQTERLWPAFASGALGLSFFLGGYLLFARYVTKDLFR